jgi:hypothetical protein
MSTCGRVNLPLRINYLTQGQLCGIVYLDEKERRGQLLSKKDRQTTLRGSEMNWKVREEVLTYNSWHDMMSRCYVPYHQNFKGYGGLGIKVCEEWHDYERFVASMGLKPEGMTLERIDNNVDYERANCLWATRAEQARNRCSNTVLTYNGRTMCAVDWARELGIPQETIYGRVRRGCSIEQILHVGRLSKGQRS